VWSGSVDNIGWSYVTLVMATHGRTGLPRAVVGNVAAETIALTEVPVLLVRPPPERVGRSGRRLSAGRSSPAAESEHQRLSR
jgi:hypothetical protein